MGLESSRRKVSQHSEAQVSVLLPQSQKLSSASRRQSHHHHRPTIPSTDWTVHPVPQRPTTRTIAAISLAVVCGGGG